MQDYIRYATAKGSFGLNGCDALEQVLEEGNRGAFSGGPA